MLDVLSEETKNGYKIIKYTKNGTTVSHTVKKLIQEEIEPVEQQPTIEEQILFETQYQTAVLEILFLGGI